MDLVMFYVFFESILPLLFLLIGLYGASQKFKAGYYFFLRILINIFSSGTTLLTPFFFIMCGVSVIFASSTTVRQFDLKVIVAYSSIAHMASSLFGTFSDNL